MNISKILKNHKKWVDDEEGGVRADLRGANLHGADLREADLRGADLSEANLSRTNLSEADLRWANLSEANLRGADLSKTNLRGADIKDTILDPRNMIPDATDKLIDAGLTIKDGIVYGYRTKRSMFCGNTVYNPGRYEAPVFST
jgi:uncharacterized protein YjbI with pentapeptide repeats